MVYAGGGGLPESSAAVAGGEAEYGHAGFGWIGCFDSRLEAHIKEVTVHPAASFQSDGCGWPDWWLLEPSTEARVSGGEPMYSPAREGDGLRIFSIFLGLQAHQRPTVSVSFPDREKVESAWCPGPSRIPPL
jgi:hypothetical protein